MMFLISLESGEPTFSEDDIKHYNNLLDKTF